MSKTPVKESQKVFIKKWFTFNDLFRKNNIKFFGWPLPYERAAVPSFATSGS